MTTTAPKTTVPVTAPSDDIEILKKAIAQAAIEHEIVDLRTCTADPTSCEVLKVTPENGTTREILFASITKMIANGERFREGDDPSSLVITRIEVTPDRLSAEVYGCYWNTTIVFVPKGNPDGTDRIVNADKQSEDVRYGMVLQNGRWQTAFAKTLQTYPGVNKCVAG